MTLVQDDGLLLQRCTCSLPCSSITSSFLSTLALFRRPALCILLGCRSLCSHSWSSITCSAPCENHSRVTSWMIYLFAWIYSFWCLLSRPCDEMMSISLSLFLFLSLNSRAVCLFESDFDGNKETLIRASCTTEISINHTIDEKGRQTIFVSPTPQTIWDDRSPRHRHPS